MVKKKTAKKTSTHHHKITVIVPDKIANLPSEVLERVGAAIGTAAVNYHIKEVEIVAASDVVCTPSVTSLGGGWDTIF
jgi:hypothetical protein